jgi:hypothetical protein
MVSPSIAEGFLRLVARGAAQSRGGPDGLRTEIPVAEKKLPEKVHEQKPGFLRDSFISSDLAARGRSGGRVIGYVSWLESRGGWDDGGL